MAGRKKLRARADKARISSMTRHVLVCTGGDCTPGEEVAKRIKKGVAAAGLRAEVTTTKTDCLSICKGKGTNVVVYPEGTWYGNVGPDMADRIVSEHLIRGVPAYDAAFLVRPLQGG